MSALLPISERVYELNLSAEHGFTHRSFKRSVSVYQSSDYKSALFLVFVTYRRALPHRKTPYRNHFTLYRSADTVVVVRSETTLRFQDHDAALQYDVVKPTESYRASAQCDWTVSFDKIQYSSAKPSFLGFTLVCSGEWWYFENGVILNGITAYERDTACCHMFVYYELHPKYNIVAPVGRNGSLNRLDAQTRLLSQAGSSTSLPPFLVGRHRLPTNDAARDNSPTSTTATTTGIGGSVSAEEGPTRTASASDIRTPLCSFLKNHNNCDGRSDRMNVVQAATLNSNITPIVNTLARPVIRSNDAQEVPDLDVKNVIPTIFWFSERSKELHAGRISYFLPKDFKPTADTSGTRFGLLNDAFYNMGLPVVPLPQVHATSDDQ